MDSKSCPNLKTSNKPKTIVSTYGILGDIFSDGQFIVTYPYWDETFQSYSQFCNKYQSSTICLIENEELYGKNFYVFKTIDKELELNNLFHGIAKILGFSPTYEFIFYLNAFQYSLSSIVRSHMQVSSDFSRTLKIPNSPFHFQKNDGSLLKDSKLPISWIQKVPVEKINASVFSSRNSNTIFYEMMAFLSSARSLLDAIVRFIRFRPDIEFPKAVRKKPSYHTLRNNISKSKIPDNLKNEIVQSWSWASDLIDYRDCLLHYTILHKSCLPDVIVFHSEERIIGLFAQLPDNPSARKIANFQFDNRIDYLSYAHSTYLKLFDLCYFVLQDTYSTK
jgi:hypothetical protein